jgi:hypothetical protein
VSTITAVRERPILFQGALVRAILDGRKTVTRRPVKPQPPASALFDDRFMPWPMPGHVGYQVPGRECRVLRCPYGAPGERLWCRETWREVPSGASGLFLYRANHESCRRPGCIYCLGLWRPSIFMPRSACHLVLEVTDVRVERLNQITAEEVSREGLDFEEGRTGEDFDRAEHALIGGVPIPGGCGEVAAFAAGWDRLYRAKPALQWTADPWTWRIAFKVVEARR